MNKMSDEKMRQRLRTIAELKLLGTEVDVYIDELLQDYGKSQIEMAVAELGLSNVLGDRRCGHDYDR